ncbi:hypothetical protein Q3A66_20365 [Hymenobacter sp. BT770]|uniref:hypothetical protein n=1 Tax=Hymenobacter sp. BT770 TaxID=2886942 RepID=UPI001D11F548|nr:hypothetical protein [Hymenobacter sp. BT770]MCC3155395.1 hypothetical protein [Hymenobacter sp. BT770]MDO3417428.1 hypothetical protein [Hymenobacter sp. BT770]
MSDLQNPLFDEEKEFLERKKLEYERALRGDVDHIKDQSVKAGKVALVGAGLAGGIWLITKAFGGKKKRKRYAQDDFDRAEHRYNGEADNFEGDDEFGGEAEYYTAGNGKRYKSVRNYRTAADSAQAFMEQDRQEPGHDADDLGFGSKAVPQPEAFGGSTAGDLYDGSAFQPEDFEDDPFKDLPYDDSRRLPASHAFDDDETEPLSSRPAPRPKNNMVAAVLQSFLKSDTGKVLVAQVAAVALAMVTKKVSEFFPADKNPDLATSSGYAPTETGFAPATSPATPDSPDASTHTSSI